MKRLALILLLLFAATQLAGCGKHGLRHHLADVFPQLAPQESPRESKTPPRKAEREARREKRPAKAEQRKVPLREQLDRQLQAQEYAAALALIRQQVAAGTAETALAEPYRAALNGLLAQAESHREKGELVAAGQRYRTAHDHYPATAKVAKGVTLSAATVQRRIDSCVDELMAQGLVAYRAGDLDAAITTWQAIHTFAPDHRPSQQALTTAETQRANLQKVRKR